MSSSQDATPPSLAPEPPPGFHTIEQIRDESVFTNAAVKSRTLVSVIGFVVDFRPPIPTQGTDWKSSFKVVDQSVSENSRAGLEVSIFGPKNLPTLSKADVVIIRNARIQMYKGSISLIINQHQTRIHSLSASDVPYDVKDSYETLWKSILPQGKPFAPSAAEMAYVVQANNCKADMDIPSDHEFQEKVIDSMKVKEKFKLLEDVKAGKFCDILGEVCRIFDGTAPWLTVYLTDYTTNEEFYNYVWSEDSDMNESDEYGYSKRTSLQKTKKDRWPGPYGKMTVQLTLYDAQADYARNNVKVGQWVLMKNVQFKHGKTSYLEGVLRTDRGKGEDYIHIEEMERPEYSNQIDIRWKNGLVRKRGYERSFNTQKQAMIDKAKVGDKRKHDDDQPGKKNSKQRRKEQRAAALNKETARNDLNENIICAHPDKPILAVKTILEHRKFLEREDEGISPFTVCKYRAIVRVVDYFPHKLEDFAVGYRNSDYELLSDYSGNEDTDLEEDRRIFRSGQGFKKDTWEWRFALQVEDLSTKTSNDRLWLMVDNHAAQGLLGLDQDATSLREDRQLLHSLREQLFKLWGDLEEQKSARLAAEDPTSTFDSISSSPLPTRIAGDQPDADDSDDEKANSDRELSKKNYTEVSTLRSHTERSDGENKVPAKNKPFTCCIRQYGVKVKESEPSKADAGNGQRWQRMFGLFGTQII